MCELPPSPVPTSKQSNHTKRGNRIRIKLKRPGGKSHNSSVNSQQSDKPKAKRALFKGGSVSSVDSSHSDSTSSLKGADAVTVNGDIGSPRSPSVPKSMSVNSSLPSIDEPMMKTERKESLALVFQQKMEDETEEGAVSYTHLTLPTIYSV